jgi:hypothetical protein
MVVLQAIELGPLGTRAGIMITLFALIAVLVVGRVFLELAWKAVFILIWVVIGLWVLNAIGFGLGIVGAAPPVHLG